MFSLEEIYEHHQGAPPYPHRYSKANEFQRMAWRELNHGRYSRSIQLLEMSLKSLPPIVRNPRGNRYTMLAKYYAYAGARALLTTNWRVETNSAKALTTDLFRRQAQNPLLTRAEALRQSKLFLIDGVGRIDSKSGTVLFSYAHPIFWAAFSLVGG